MRGPVHGFLATQRSVVSDENPVIGAGHGNLPGPEYDPRLAGRGPAGQRRRSRIGWTFGPGWPRSASAVPGRLRYEVFRPFPRERKGPAAHSTRGRTLGP